jgi:hypothetical protein
LCRVLNEVSLDWESRAVGFRTGTGGLCPDPARLRPMVQAFVAVYLLLANSSAARAVGLDGCHSSDRA